MRVVTLFISTTADGKIANENGDTTCFNASKEAGFQEFYASIDTILMGRVSFEKQLAQGPWPYSNKKTFVFSKSLKNQFGERIEVVARDAATFLEDFKMTPGKRIWLAGGAELARSLMNEHLVDEIILTIYPEIIGKGLDLFPLPLHSMFWRLDSSKELANGLVQVRYIFLGTHET
jgi:dihydrofolate reductase